MYFDQAEFAVRCEWGRHGIEQVALQTNLVIIVEVLSFSTCVEIATQRGAIVFPYPWRDGTAPAFANSVQAELAGKRGQGSRYSLSPTALMDLDAGLRLVLPSPNGSSLSRATGKTPTLAGCLRNAEAVAAVAAQYGSPITVVPAGERWPDGSLRPALEDWLGTGAIIRHLPGRWSPEAEAAVAAYEAMADQLGDRLKACSSGRELIEQGFEQDVVLAAAVNVSDCVPTLVNQAYVNRSVQ